ncbi:MAG: DUF4270 domain-containing protein [Tannerellaceae bacterium]|nr:DUF4270 domain-containing protein [Tannerellaceae bacterium]
MNNFWHNLLCLSAATLTFVTTACDDEWTRVGTSIQAGEDRADVSIINDFRFEAITAPLDSVYARTTAGLLGRLYDPLLGDLQADYICQFYCPADFRFTNTPYKGLIDSVELRLYYESWVGDSLAPMRAQVFAVDRPLERNFYTNINPADYCNFSQPLGSHVYTPFDCTVPDSIRYYKDADSSYTFYPQINIRLPHKFGQDFYDETLNNPSSFASQDAFNRFLPGLYITTDFGAGNIIRIDLSYLNIYYRYAVTGSDGQDSLVNGGERFSVTREVLQLNRAEHIGMETLLTDNADFTYLKTPAGLYTRITLPTTAMHDLLGDRILNNVPFEPTPMPFRDDPYDLPYPPYLLLLPEDSITTFFENGRIEDNRTAYLYTYNSTTATYQYSVTTYSSYSSTPTTTYTPMNISGIVKQHFEQAPADSDLRLALIPVNRQTQVSYNTLYTSALTHYHYPSALTLRKDTAVTHLPITATRYGR